MTIREIKIDFEDFNALAMNQQRAAICSYEMPLEVGDALILCQTVKDDPKVKNGKVCWRIVTHVLSDFGGLQPGHALLSIRPLFTAEKHLLLEARAKELSK